MADSIYSRFLICSISALASLANLGHPIMDMIIITFQIDGFVKIARNAKIINRVGILFNTSIILVVIRSMGKLILGFVLPGINL